MSRAVPEWQGKTDDAAIPPRVKLRVLDRQLGVCAGAGCVAVFGPKTPPEFDHIVPLILHGKHRESNLQALCKWCHAHKTAVDVAVKAKVASVRKKHLGVAGPKRGFPTNRNGKFRRTMDGRTIRRDA